MNLSRYLFPRTRSFWLGASLPFRAGALILRKPKLIFWSLLPIGITLSLYTWLITRLQDAARLHLMASFDSWGWSPEGWAAWSLLLISKVVLLLVGAMTFSVVASVAASPFNDFLAENAEPWAHPPLAPVQPSTVGAKVKLIFIDLGKTLAATAASITALLFSWIPFLNLIAFLIAFLLVCFQYTSYPQTRRGVGLADGLRFLWSHLYVCAGFGAMVTVLFAIPLVASLAVPMAVVGGTLLVARAPGQKPELLPLR